MLKTRRSRMFFTSTKVMFISYKI